MAIRPEDLISRPPPKYSAEQVLYKYRIDHWRNVPPLYTPKSQAEFRALGKLYGFNKPMTTSYLLTQDIVMQNMRNKGWVKAERGYWILMRRGAMIYEIEYYRRQWEHGERLAKGIIKRKARFGS